MKGRATSRKLGRSGGSLWEVTEELSLHANKSQLCEDLRDELGGTARVKV